MLTAVRDPQPWAHALDAAVRVGPFIERAHPRPADDHDSGTIAVALIHPGAGHAAACLHGRRLGCTDRSWLRRETTTVLGTRQPACTMLTHAAANLPLPDDIGMTPAHYGVHAEARHADGTGCTRKHGGTAERAAGRTWSALARVRSLIRTDRRSWLRCLGELTALSIAAQLSGRARRPASSVHPGEPPVRHRTRGDAVGVPPRRLRCPGRRRLRAGMRGDRVVRLPVAAAVEVLIRR